MRLLHANAVMLTAMNHVVHFVVYLMAGASAAGLILVIYLLFQLEYSGAEAQSADLLPKVGSLPRETCDKS
ncbi:MAG TPA: hypothetical protein VGU64_23385 [Terriglobales bacterium]|nr:hypothetical protein [Terriglobales bacterium]